MQYIHAHWRMAYVQTPREKKDQHSPFLQALRSADARENLRLFQDDHTFILMNRFPYTAGHLLVLPVREVSDFEELTTIEQQALFATMLHGQRILRKGMHPQGFNLGWNIGSAGGAGLPRHLHGHVVPRWDGDNNFMPVIGQTRVLPQALEELYDHLIQFV